MTSYFPDIDKVVIFRLLYRPISYPFSRAAVSLNINPNLITLIGFIVIIIANISAVAGNILAAILLTIVAQIIDCVDGNVARKTKNKTYLGKLVDGFVDAFGFTIYATISIGLSRQDIFANQWCIIMVTGLVFSLSPIFNLLFKQRYDYVTGMMPISPKSMSSSRQEIKTASFLKKISEFIDSNAMPSYPFILMITLLIHSKLFLCAFIALSGLTGIYCWLMIVARLKTNYAQLIMRR